MGCIVELACSQSKGTFGDIPADVCLGSAANPAMPYRLRVTEGEVRQELDRMGFKGLSDDTVAAMHKDLLKMIKSDLRKMKQERQAAEYEDISDLQLPATAKQDKHHEPSERRLHPSALTPKKTHAKERSYGSLSGSYTSEDKDESTGESGYSDVESTSATGMSEVDDSYSGAAEVPEKQTSAKVKPKRPKEAATKDLIKSSKEPALGSSVETIALGTKTARKTKLKQVEKKDLPQYPSKPDPVRLYHYYKAHWDRYKMPGEDPRLKLRWAVRSKLFYAE